MKRFVHSLPDEVPVWASADQTVIDTCSLVLSAKNIRHRISEDPTGEKQIHVSGTAAENARYQLDCFFRENRNWPPREPVGVQDTFPATAPTLFLVVALALFFQVTGPWQYDSPWFRAGAGDADAILNGEWYRLVTSLTLHADFAHLAGNCLIGAFLIHFFLQINGTGLGTLAILVSAAIGNLINVLAHGGDHLSVGFSTAVFSIIGMLSMHQIIDQRRLAGIRVLVPFMAGAALLAMLGSAGERTDLGGHFFGLLSGFLFGLPLGMRQSRPLKRSAFLQNCCIIAAICLVLFCWTAALERLA